jgi:hypothetical protein
MPTPAPLLQTHPYFALGSPGRFGHQLKILANSTVVVRSLAPVLAMSETRRRDDASDPIIIVPVRC